MEIKIRLLTGQTKTFEVDADVTIAHLKGLLEDEYDRDSVKFVFKGKIMSSEDALVSSIQMEENDALVLVGKKKILQDMKKPPQQARKADAFKTARNIGASEKGKTEKSSATAPPNAQSTAIPVSEEVIENIVSMGFDRTLVIDALKRSHFNPELAIEYCLTGLPSPTATGSGETIDAPEDADLSSQTNDLMHLQNLLSGRATRRQEETALVKALRELPNFEEIRTLVAGRESSLIPAVVDEVEKSFPDIYRLIQDEPEEFMQLILQGLPKPSTTTVTLDPQAIERLMNIGNFSRQEATQAYLLANRDENIAASILFEAQEMRMDQSYD
mmetsp:Transcript_38/g.84  ORF Transcript_38/g.84 Transcript_38/m.84 type:complete len:329 (-) Transcript_38:176-1162(-)